MFCRLGSVLDSRPVAATSWLYVVWTRSWSSTIGISESTTVFSRDDVAVAQQVLEERVLGLGVQVLQRVGVGGVAGLDLLRLRQPELVEQHLLQLLRRAEVHLVADRGVRQLRRALHLAGEPRLELGQPVDRSAAMPVRSMSASSAVSGSSSSVSSREPPRSLEHARRARRRGR